MIIAVVARALGRALERGRRGRWFPLLPATIAFGSTVTMSLPFGPCLVAAVLLRRDRWILVSCASALGSATGGLVLYLVFHHLGWAQVIAWFPDLPDSPAWGRATRWIAAYGAPALLATAAPPLPQTPALVFVAIMRLPVGEVFIALLAGKLIKHDVYASLVAAFPGRFAGSSRDLHGLAVLARGSGAARPPH